MHAQRIKTGLVPKRLLPVFALMALLGMAHPESAAQSVPLQLITETLAAFKAERPPRKCDSENLTRAARAALRITADVGRNGMPVWMTEIAGTLGGATVDVADAAREAGCNTQARALYVLVLRTYVGLFGYSAIKHRAERGMLSLN